LGYFIWIETRTRTQFPADDIKVATGVILRSNNSLPDFPFDKTLDGEVRVTSVKPGSTPGAGYMPVLKTHADNPPKKFEGDAAQARASVPFPFWAHLKPYKN
jgi:hypothetical protein